MADPEKTSAPAQAPDDEPVPRLGRGRRRKVTYFPPGEIISIFALLIGLFAVIALKDSCARAGGQILQQFEAPADAGAHGVPRPSLAPPPVVPEQVPMAPRPTPTEGTPTLPNAKRMPPGPGEGLPPTPPGATRLPAATPPAPPPAR